MSYYRLAGPFTAVSMIIALVGACMIPTTGGTIPIGTSVEDFQKQQIQMVVSSREFLVTMVGVGMTFLGCFCLILKLKNERRIEIAEAQMTRARLIVREPRFLIPLAEPMPILQVKRTDAPVKSILKAQSYREVPKLRTPIEDVLNL